MLIETGNHVSQSSKRRYELARGLAQLIRKTADEESPWAAFTQQAHLWTRDGLIKLAAEWPAVAKAGCSIGDATIEDVASFYQGLGYQVEIFTGDRRLKAKETAPRPALVPRRRR